MQLDPEQRAQYAAVLPEMTDVQLRTRCRSSALRSSSQSRSSRRQPTYSAYVR
jgi:hypothetical protein